MTGGTSGIGLATVARFVAEGARVMIADIQVDAEEFIAYLAETRGPRVSAGSRCRVGRGSAWPNRR